MTHEPLPADEAKEVTHSDTLAATATSQASRECSACREPIGASAGVCPHCRSPQGGLRIGVVAFRWVAAALTVVTLVLGVREGVELVASHLETREVLRTRLRASETLLEAREYRAAWQLAEEAASRAPDDPRVLAQRVAVARAWLLDASSLGSDRIFLDIVERVVPLLAAVAPSRPRRERAELLALLAFAQHLRERSEFVDVDVTGLYRQALDLDPNCGLAHLLLGLRLAQDGDLEGALPHFARAIERADAGELDLALVRRYQFAVLSGLSRVGSDEVRTLAGVELMRAVNDVRRRGHPLPIDERDRISGRSTVWHDLESLHRDAVFEPEEASALRSALPVEQHLATLRWLYDGRPDQGRLDGLGFWIALILEEQGDAEGAGAALRGLPREGRDDRLSQRIDQELLRLTGEPHRPLRERDPWTWLVESLGTSDPGSPAFVEALNEATEYTDLYHNGWRAEDDRLLLALEAAHANWTRRDRETNPNPLSPASREQWRGLRLDLGIILTEGRQHGRALEILSALAGELSAGHRLRGRTLVAMAAAHARRALAEPERGDADMAAGTALIAQAVEQEGYADWARLRWHEDLGPLREAPRFMELLERSGRLPAADAEEAPDVH